MSREYVTRGGDTVRHIERFDFRGKRSDDFREGGAPVRDNSRILEARVVIGFACRYYASPLEHSIPVQVRGTFLDEWRVIQLPRSKYNPRVHFVDVVTPLFDVTISLDKFAATPRQLGTLAIPYVFPDQSPHLDGVDMQLVDQVRDSSTPLRNIDNPHLHKVDWGSIWYKITASSAEAPKSVQ